MKRAFPALLACLVLRAQDPAAFAPEMRAIEERVGGMAGAAAIHLESGRIAGWRAKERFPMLELVQLPVALHALAQMELGEMPFHKLVRFEPARFAPGHSPLRDRYPDGAVLTIGQLLEAAVRDNDASATDALLALGGGPAAVEKRMARWFGEGIRVGRSLSDLDLAFRMAPSRERFLMDEGDSITPETLALLMSAIEEGKLLHPKSHERLKQWMRGTPHGAERLPEAWRASALYWKSGSTAFWDGRNACMSIAAVVRLPGSRGRLALAVLLKGTERDLTQREQALAGAADALYRWFAALPEK
ncbi:MAG: class A beta-lactamase-related serine hydrolase [Bryobacteraceae bacterium]|nr:class A beta-lactamase-related serine hydrolase [Bryobacteraceae bacterium]